jgi:L-fuconate dehydratase
MVGSGEGSHPHRAAALINSVWDLYARAEQKPVWKLLAEMEPEQIIRAVNFRYITDALTPDEALELLKRSSFGKEERLTLLEHEGYLLRFGCCCAL